jgi:hypothetical protein
MNAGVKNAVVMAWADEKEAYVPFIYDNGIASPILNKLYKSAKGAMEFGANCALTRKKLFGKNYDLLLLNKDATEPEYIELIPIKG